MRRPVLIFGGLAALLFCGYLYYILAARAHVQMLPPENHNSTTIYVLKRRILHYAKENDKLPTSLAELPDLEGFNSRRHDYWGNEIIYSVEGTRVTLRSNGKDNVAGGAGDNLDVIGIFEARNITGEWADSSNDVEWKQRPLRGEESQKVPHNQAL